MRPPSRSRRSGRTVAPEGGGTAAGGRVLIERLVNGRDGIRWVLHTRREAAGFYAKLGFTAAPDMLWRDRR